MTRKLFLLAICGAGLGCTPENLLTSTIPATPPAKTAYKPGTTDAEPARAKAPITPTSITSQNAQEKLVDLEAELEHDAKVTTAKP